MIHLPDPAAARVLRETRCPRGDGTSEYVVVFAVRDAAHGDSLQAVLAKARTEWLRRGDQTPVVRGPPRHAGPGSGPESEKGEPALIEISETEVKQLLRLVEFQLERRFGSHHQFADLLAAGYAGAWKAIVDVEETGACMRSTAAVRGAVYAALDWLRGPENDSRRRTKRRVRLPRKVPVEAADREEHASPDFAPQVLARAAAAAQLARWQAESGLSELDWQILERTLGDGEGGKQVARELGIGVRELAERQAAALARLRGEAP